MKLINYYQIWRNHLIYRVNLVLSGLPNFLNDIGGHICFYVDLSGCVLL